MFGEHAAFIIPSYVISAAALIGATVWINLVWRARKRELEQVEKQLGPGDAK